LVHIARATSYLEATMTGTFFSGPNERSFISTFLCCLGFGAGALFAGWGKREESKKNDGGDAGTSSGQGGSGGSSGSDHGGSSAAGRGGGGGSPGGRGGTDQGGTTAGGEGPGGCAGECGDCEETETRRYGQHAKSSGFSGTDAQYSQLYDVLCASVDDCVAPCMTRGGTTMMCEASICVDSTSDYCLPPTVWRNLMTLRSEGTDPTDGAELVLVFDPYQDVLLVDDFKLEVPADAEILGITVTIRRAGGSSMESVDGAVRLIKGGVVGASDRSLPAPWAGPAYVNVDYGGPTDLWGETWTPADVNAAGFGVALSALYTETAGNGRAYVDIVYATVHYRTCN
jgi:hypothetical protein